MHVTNTSSVPTIRQIFGGTAWRHDHQCHTRFIHMKFHLKQRVDRRGLLRDSKGDRRQEEVETAGFKVIVGAPTTLRVTGLMMTMMMMCISVFPTIHGQEVNFLHLIDGKR